MKKLLKVLIWYPAAVASVFFSIQTYITYSLTQGAPGLIRQEVLTIKNNKVAFAAVPKIAFEIKTALASQDARPVLIDKYLARYGSPMEGLGANIVQLSDSHSVDPYLVVAIAQQESNLGKIMPPHCHNAWGWGIHSAGTLCFDSWQEGLNTFISGLANNYHAYGLVSPEEVMTKYNPTSPNGAWAKGVQQFLTELETGDF